MVFWTILKYHSRYYCQIPLQVMLLPILIAKWNLQQGKSVGVIGKTSLSKNQARVSNLVLTLPFACLAILRIPSCHWIWKAEWQAESRKLIQVSYISQVSLEDLYNGATRQLALQKSVLCPKCEGIGGKKVCCVCCLCHLWPCEAFFFICIDLISNRATDSLI